MRVVAEGVEDHDIAAILTEWGCDLLQGYAFTRPCTEDELTAWMHRRSARPAPRASGDVISLRSVV